MHQLSLNRIIGEEWDLDLQENEDGKFELAWADDTTIDLPQRLKYYLRTYRNEFELDTSVGLPFFQLFFVKGTDGGTIANTIEKYILNRLLADTNYNVLELFCEVMSYDPQKRLLNVFLFVKTEEDEVTVNELF